MNPDYYVCKLNNSQSKEYTVPCLKCNVYTTHKVLLSVDISEFIPYLNEYWEEYQIIQCQGCRSISFRKSHRDTDHVYTDVEGREKSFEHEELYPARPPRRGQLRHSSFLPQLVLQIYNETYSALVNSLTILAGIGIRALIEAVCIEKNAKGKNLMEKIDDLVTIGTLSRDGAQILHAMRSLGNESAHEIKPQMPDILEIAMDVVENLLQSTYILPMLAKKVEDRNEIPF